MKEIIIDEEFKFLLPTLDTETFARLEEDLLKNGCRDALVLWGDVLIDGYNRYAICSEHDIPFSTVNMELDTREDVLIWIITNQVSRRNLTPIQLSHFRGVHYRAERQLVKNKTGGNQYTEVKRQNGAKPKSLSTAKQLADKYRVSSRTIDRDSKTAAAIDAIGEISPEAKRKILAGEMHINRKTLKELSAMQADELTDIAAKIEEGTFEKPHLTTSAESSKEEAQISSNLNRNEKHSLDVYINNMISDHVINLQEFSNTKVSKKTKTALRGHIDMLEDLYRQI